VKVLSSESGYPVEKLCSYLKIPRSAYYRWLKQPKSHRKLANELIAEEIQQIHNNHPDMGYRRIRDELDVNYDIDVNDKRILRICRTRAIQSTIKWKPKSCTRADRNPDHISKNYLNRDFHAEEPNEKWLTDVTEFKYYVGIETHKVYLSAILDLYDRRIVAFRISDHNDNPLVLDTFDEAVKLEPDAHPLFHSDRGFQNTSAQFHMRLKKHHMKQSMSRVAHCIDNGPMEGFWGILKREMYYGHRFTDHDALVKAISDYIDYYNNRRLQRRLKIMPPMAFHNHYWKAA
jgi:transposase InsO family protein